MQTPLRKLFKNIEIFLLFLATILDQTFCKNCKIYFMFIYFYSIWLK